MPRISSASANKRRKRPSNAIRHPGWWDWIRLKDVPFAESTTRKLIDQGAIMSALVLFPGSKRGVRLVQASSLDAYLRSLAEAQTKKKEVVAVE